MDKIFRPFQKFLQLESSSGFLLLACLGVAISWSNSPWADTYHGILEMKVGLSLGGFSLEKSVLHWINDGLMTLFFLVVGLEIKRELVAGELASIRRAALPFIAAMGGMVTPALIYFAFNHGTESARGWGIPMATDIPFALGILALLGNRVSPSLKVFLAALAIIDDLGSVLVIAIFYTSHISGAGLAAASGIFALLVLLGRLGVRAPVVYLLLGIPLWYLLLHSGVHGTIAGVLVAWTIPSRTPLPEKSFASEAMKIVSRFNAASYQEETPMLNQERLDSIAELEQACRKVEPPLQRLERIMHPWTSFLILPLFALANAGIQLKAGSFGGLAHPVGFGIILGLLLGKPLGIFLASWFSVKLGIAELPHGNSFKEVLGVGMLGGIGFTMSIFVAGLAFTDNERLVTAKLAIFSASVLSGFMGWAFLRLIVKKGAGHF